MNTPFAYSIVPIAPSKSTSEFGSVRRARAGEVMSGSGGTTYEDRSDARAFCGAHGVVFGLRVMHENGGGALLGHQLEGARELHPELLLGRKNPEERRVILEVGTRAVAPGVALAAVPRDAELAAYSPVHPLRDRFRGFDGEAVRV